MLTVPIYNTMGEEVGAFEVDENVLGGKLRRRLMHDAIVMYQANQRQGTAKTKTRGEVAGSTKKPYRQKGTGNARAGSRKSPIWRGGGTIFGPRPRDYGYTMPRKARRAALKSALLSKILDNEAILLDQLELPEIKTKQMVEILSRLKISNESCLLALENHDSRVWRSARNIEKLKTKPASDINAYDVLRGRRLLMTRAAFEGLLESFESNKKAEG